MSLQQPSQAPPLQSGVVNFSLTPYSIGSFLLRQDYYITLQDVGEIYRYDSTTGIYVPDGEFYIDTKLANLLTHKYSPRRVSGTISYIKSQTRCDRSTIGPPKDELVVANGILNLKTHQLKPHDPSIHAISHLPVNYDATKDCPIFKRFLTQIISQVDISILQEFIGYCLTPDYPHKLALLIQGPTDSGKTTLINTLSAFFGPENRTFLTLQQLEERFYESLLYGKMVNLCDDLSIHDLRDVSKFKQFTGNSPTIGDKKFKDQFEFVNQAKFIFTTNKISKAPETADDSFYRRWMILKTTTTFNEPEQDRELLFKLASPDEQSGILNWAGEGLNRLNSRGYFEHNMTVEDVKVEFGRGDSISQFIQKRTKMDATSVVTKKELYKAYCDFCSNVFPAKSYEEFTTRVSNLSEVSITRPSKYGERPQSLRGIKLRD